MRREAERAGAEASELAGAKSAIVWRLLARDS